MREIPENRLLREIKKLLNEHKNSIDERFDRLEMMLAVIYRKENEQMGLAADIKAKITNNSSGLDSIQQGIALIKAKLDAAIASGASVAELQEISDSLDAENAKIIATAALANTDAAPE